MKVSLLLISDLGWVVGAMEKTLHENGFSAKPNRMFSAMLCSLSINNKIVNNNNEFSRIHDEK